jgi:EAL domain-containing protein (putative c-di-GMP-specific phosphodiesterase class I)
LRLPHHIHGHELHVTASIGIVSYPDDGEDVETLMKKADSAMYQAKEKGRDGFEFFRSQMSSKAIERQLLEASLHHAIERQELVLHYQSKLDLASGEVVGAEALIRWRHPQFGLLPPGRFIAIAQECGLIVPIGRWVLREACRQARAWQAAGWPPLSVAVNICAAELRAPGFVAGVREILKETGLEPRYLELELTDTAVMDDSRSVSEMLRELKEIGVLLALDDFGTGHTSLTHLKGLAIDALNIDQSFLRDLATHEDGVSVLTSMIAMGKNLNMQVVAKGVETQEQLQILQHHGCPQAQGFYFSRPVPAVELPQLLRRTQTEATFV